MGNKVYLSQQKREGERYKKEVLPFSILIEAAFSAAYRSNNND